jgi:hypothetical protein
VRWQLEIITLSLSFSWLAFIFLLCTHEGGEEERKFLVSVDKTTTAGVAAVVSARTKRRAYKVETTGIFYWISSVCP